ncbi:MAG: hypothetical protein ACPG7F_20360, partial [Aggregatilineales bacterium]
MGKIKNPFGRIAIHMVLIIFAIYSAFPFVWTALQSIKSFKDANSRTPLFWGFEPTWENYQEVWLRSIPETGGAAIAFFLLLAVVLLVSALIFAKYIPLPTPAVYGGVAVGFVILLWAIPQIVDVSQFYDYFINTLIVTVGTIVVS